MITVVGNYSTTTKYNTCNAILKSGKRKGEICGKKSLKYTITPTQQFCKAHEKWSDNFKNKPVCIPIPETNIVVTI